MKGKKFLILQRSTKETSMHGLWELPGGKVEEGETPRQTAVIEVKEEAGLDIKLKANLGPHHDNKKKKTSNTSVLELQEVGVLVLSISLTVLVLLTMMISLSTMVS